MARFIKIPFSKQLRAGKDTIHYVWIDVSQITHVEYKNSDKDESVQCTRVYLKKGNDSTWYQTTIMTPEEVMAMIMGPSEQQPNVEGIPGVMQMLDNELSNTLMMTQELLRQTMSAQRKAEGENEMLRVKLSTVESEIKVLKTSSATRPRKKWFLARFWDWCCHRFTPVV